MAQRQQSPNQPSRGAWPSRQPLGQGLVELALVLPILLFLIGIILEGGLALNAWMRVNNAARDGTRFALDAGRDADLRDLVLDRVSGLDQGKLDIYVIRSGTDNGGQIGSNPNQWNNSQVSHVWGSRSGGPSVTPRTIQQGLNSSNASANANILFTIVEVDYIYTPFFITLVTGGADIPMTSYALVQQYSQLYQ